MFTAKQQTKLDRFTQVLEDSANQDDIQLKVDKKGNYIRTSWSLCEIIIQQIKNSVDDLSDKKIIVVDTVEFIPVLLILGARKQNITFIASYEFKGRVAEILGVEVIADHLLTWETNMEFDVVVGNPPFTRGLDQKFLNKSLKLLKNNGYLAYITPRAFAGNNSSGSNNFSGFYEYQMKLLHLWSKEFQEQYFKNIGTGICWFVIKKNKKKSDIRISYNEQAECLTTIVPNGRGFPDIVNNMSIKIHHHIVQYDVLDMSIATGGNLDVRKDINDSELIAAGRIQDNPTKIYQYKHYTSHILIRYANFQQNQFSDIKVCIYVQQKPQDAFIVDKGNTGQDIFFVTCNTNKEAKNLIKIFKSKFFRYLTEFYGAYGRAPFREIRRILPYIDYSKEYTDEEIYEYFKLEDDMIEYIEQVVK